MVQVMGIYSGSVGVRIAVCVCESVKVCDSGALITWHSLWTRPFWELVVHSTQMYAFPSYVTIFISVQILSVQIYFYFFSNSKA
jgi:hypothetical protein